MTMRRREIVLALAALGFTSTHAAALDPSGGQAIGQAYLAARPGAPPPDRLAAELLPGGWTAADEPRLRARVAADFRAGRTFVFRGWRLSDTEGALFAALG
ncbi:MAG: hypothetical protein DI570_04645 [Phenylobacterium zucineum]|nr:MAG: hypothetical protein DI570_04645 [Phenylobacterium zucineum]